MKTTYNQTFTMSNATLRKATIKVIVHNADNAGNILEEKNRLFYTGLTEWDVIEGGEEAKEIERDLNADEMDFNHEYLVLHFEDGNTATFCNSNVFMFIR